MESRSFKGLTVKSMKDVVEETKEYIGRRKRGEERSLRVSSDKVNNAFMGGFD